MASSFLPSLLTGQTLIDVRIDNKQKLAQRPAHSCTTLQSGAHKDFWKNLAFLLRRVFVLGILTLPQSRWAA
jgi:hypothetical protein